MGGVDRQLLIYKARCFTSRSYPRSYKALTEYSDDELLTLACTRALHLRFLENPVHALNDVPCSPGAILCRSSQHPNQSCFLLKTCINVFAGTNPPLLL